MQIETFADKKLQRLYLRTQRELFDAEYRMWADKEICKRFVNLDEVKNTETFLTYVSCGWETDTRQIISLLFEHKRRLFAPVCYSGGRMDFYSFSSIGELVPAKMGLLEPDTTHAQIFEGCKNAVCITPAVAFDKKGFRLGYGGGFYDRFFALHPQIMKIGLCYDDFVVSEIITDEYDKAVDIIVTEKRTIVI